MIIGLTGTMGCGKGEVVKYLKKKGFEHYIYSDILREIAKSRNIGPTRENLQKLGNEIKKDSKNLGILSKKLFQKIKTDKAIVDGIRNPDEIRELRKGKEVYIIGITASQRIRFNRLRKRGREGDPETFSQFKILDNLENRGKTKGQEINKCLKMADFTIINDSSLDNLRKKVDEILNLL